MPNPATPKTVSKFFRVAVAGATTDGRVIQESWINQMAATFDRTKYGARIWLEHIRGIAPDGLFKAYGDVIAVKAEKVKIGDEEKLALFAQIEPTADLIAMTKDKQKIYTSIEINENFANSGQCYLVGLAVTDSPASLGTEILTFAAQNPTASPFAHRKQDAANLFSAAQEVTLEFETIQSDAPDTKNGLSSLVKDLFNKFKKTADQEFADDLKAAFTTITEHVGQQDKKYADQAQELASKAAELKSLSDKFTVLQTEFTEFKNRVEKTSVNPQRPQSTGGSGDELTNC